MQVEIDPCRKKGRFNFYLEPIPYLTPSTVVLTAGLEPSLYHPSVFQETGAVQLLTGGLRFIRSSLFSGS
jgi:hypothetical protein